MYVELQIITENISILLAVHARISPSVKDDAFDFFLFSFWFMDDVKHEPRYIY